MTLSAGWRLSSTGEDGCGREIIAAKTDEERRSTALWTRNSTPSDARRIRSPSDSSKGAGATRVGVANSVAWSIVVASHRRTKELGKVFLQKQFIFHHETLRH